MMKQKAKKLFFDAIRSIFDATSITLWIIIPVLLWPITVAFVL